MIKDYLPVSRFFSPRALSDLGELVNWPLNQDDLRVNVIENAEHFQFEFQVPGMSQEDISLSYENQTLRVSTNVKKESSCDNKKYRMKEYSCESQSRSFSLPDIDSDNITAKLNNGILTVVAPKATKVKKQSIKIDG